MGRLEYNSHGQLCFDGRSLNSLASTEPTYVYSRETLEARWALFSQSISEALAHQNFSVHYALKANSNLKLLHFFKDKGLGVDVVSGGEMKKAIQAGFRPQQIVFSGVGKTEQELTSAIDQSIEQINVESSSELRRISRLAKKEVRVALRINPQVNPVTHPYISTGFKENKFGIDPDQIADCLAIIKTNSNLKLVGLTLHIGSQLLDFSAFNEALEKAKNIYFELLSQKFPLQRLDVGGGVGIHYDRDSDDQDILHSYCKVLKNHLRDFKGHVQFEPGRFLVARAGVLLAQIQYIKITPHKNFVILNSGMNHLLRPALYEAYHRIFPLQKRQGQELLVDIVGPVCESADFFAKSRIMTPLEELDHVCIADVGAYGFSMASQYNSFEMPKEVFL